MTENRPTTLNRPTITAIMRFRAPPAGADKISTFTVCPIWSRRVPGGVVDDDEPLSHEQPPPVVFQLAVHAQCRLTDSVHPATWSARPARRGQVSMAIC